MTSFEDRGHTNFEKKKKETVCAVVVTYNRKELLAQCVNALKEQTRTPDALYLIDNFSNDGTDKMILEYGHIETLPQRKPGQSWEIDFYIYNTIEGRPIRVHYVRMNKNSGGSGGFYEGVKRAYSKGYDWLWLMDDDSEPKTEALERLSRHFQEKDVAGIR